MPRQAAARSHRCVISGTRSSWMSRHAPGGMIALTGQWWLDSRKFKKADVAAHLVNLAWNGLAGLEAKPSLREAKD